MYDFLTTISKNWSAVLLCLIVIFAFLCLCLHFYKMKRMFDNDAKYEERDTNGILKKSYHRNIWDLSIFPALSKLFFKDDWKVAVAAYLLIIFLVLYLVTKEQWFAELVKVNFGLVIGALVGKKTNE
jgi:Flp pilus assembly protein protease CpaA